MKYAKPDCLPYRAVNGGCLKCGRTVEQGRMSLHRHHIAAKGDGGPDALDNLALLCAICHAEWHAVEILPTFMAFEEWLDYPPIHQLLTIFRRQEWEPDMLASELWEVMREVHRSWREQARERPKTRK